MHIIWQSHEEEDTYQAQSHARCTQYEEEDTCILYGSHMRRRIRTRLKTIRSAPKGVTCYKKKFSKVRVLVHLPKAPIQSTFEKFCRAARNHTRPRLR